MGVCVMSLEETARLEHYGIWPSCTAHEHVGKAKAQQMVEADTHRVVGGADTVVFDKSIHSMIVPVAESRLWEPVQCSAADGSKLMGMRTWGKAKSR